MYKVIKYFTDLQDNGYAYNTGDIFPREGLEVSEERFAELASSNNKRRKPLIEEIPEETAEAEPEEKPRKKKGRGKNADSDMSED
jgi:hypothetical protein